MSARPGKHTRGWGIFSRRERWGLTGRGWLILFVTIGVVAWVLFANIYPFLAVNDRVDAKWLVVEGWVHKYAIRGGAEEFRRGSYQRVFSTGGPVTGTGAYTSDYMTSAHVGAGQLGDAGVPAELVETVASRETGRDRTFGSAVALREWFHDRGIDVQSINVVTENVHARRTRLLYQKAFGADVKVGVIAVPNPDYDAKHWWGCSEGVRSVLGETIAYVYAKLFFSAAQDDQPGRINAK